MGRTCHSRRLRVFRVVTMVWVFLATLDAPLVEDCPMATSMGWMGTRGLAVAQVGAPPLTSASPRPGAPSQCAGLSMVWPSRSPLTWTSHGLTAWTEGTALCIPVLGVVHSGSQRTWTLLKLPRKCLTKCSPQIADALPPPRPALAPGGVQARVTCFCLGLTPQVPEAAEPRGRVLNEPTKTCLAPSLRNEYCLRRSWPEPAAPFLPGSSPSLHLRPWVPPWKMLSDPEEAPKIPLPHFSVCSTYIYSFCVFGALWLLLWFDHFGFVLPLQVHWSVFTSGPWQLW